MEGETNKPPAVPPRRRQQFSSIFHHMSFNRRDVDRYNGSGFVSPAPTGHMSVLSTASTVMMPFPAARDSVQSTMTVAPMSPQGRYNALHEQIERHQNDPAMIQLANRNMNHEILEGGQHDQLNLVENTQRQVDREKLDKIMELEEVLHTKRMRLRVLFSMLVCFLVATLALVVAFFLI